MYPEIDQALEPQEGIVAEYGTKYSSRGEITHGDSGLLVVTTKRVLFFHKKSVLRKLIKRDAPSYELMSSIYLREIQSVKYGGTFDKYVAINGKKHYLRNANARAVAKVIKTAVKNAPDDATATVAPPPRQKVLQQNSLAPTNNLGGPRYCQFCGKEVAAEAKFCSACGSKLD